MKKKINKKIDFVVVCLMILVTAVVSLIFNFKPLMGAIIGLLLPSIYLMIREKKNYKKIFWAVLIFGVLMGFCFDFIHWHRIGAAVSMVFKCPGFRCPYERACFRNLLRHP